MAQTGEMKGASYTFADGGILNRAEFEAVSVTLDFSGVSATDPNGTEKYVPAGTPVTAAGAPVKTTPFAGVIGLTLYDVYESRPQAAVVVEGYVHNTRAAAHSGVTYDAALVKQIIATGGRVKFEVPDIYASF